MWYERKFFVREPQMTGAMCREHALHYKNEAMKADISQKRATLLTNISRSYTALAGQLEMLAADDKSAEGDRLG
jgi:hypothetical protein